LPGPSPDPLATADYPQIVFFSGLEGALVKGEPHVRPANATTPMRVRLS